MLSKTVFILCLLLLGLHLRADDKIAVTIVPEASTDWPDGVLRGKINYDRDFHVVVSNKSPDAVRVWRDWCSWGYYNLSFDVKLANGNFGIVYHLKKKGRIWSGNYPEFYIVTPYSYYVMTVNFKEDWNSREAFPYELKKNEDVLIKAIYTIPSDKDAENYRIWTGTVESEWLRVALSWPDDQQVSNKSK